MHGEFFFLTFIRYSKFYKIKFFSISVRWSSKSEKCSWVLSIGKTNWCVKYWNKWEAGPAKKFDRDNEDRRCNEVRVRWLYYWGTWKNEERGSRISIMWTGRETWLGGQGPFQRIEHLSFRLIFITQVGIWNATLLNVCSLPLFSRVITRKTPRKTFHASLFEDLPTDSASLARGHININERVWE